MASYCVKMSLVPTPPKKLFDEVNYIIAEFEYPKDYVDGYLSIPQVTVSSVENHMSNIFGTTGRKLQAV